MTRALDRSRLRQLLENLLRNAVEHGGENVTVTVGNLPDGFYVADDGPGIPPDRQALGGCPCPSLSVRTIMWIALR